MAQQRLSRQGEPTAPRSVLEAEAAQLAPRMAAGEAVQVRHAAPPTMALHGSDPDKTFTSTVGLEVDDKYIQGAHDYHQKWGYNPTKVGSIEEVTDELSKGTGTLNRIRIVSHASQLGLYMQFAQGGPTMVMEEELRATTQAGAEQAGVIPTASYANDSALTTFREHVITSDADLAGRLSVSKTAISNLDIQRYFRWLVNKHRAEKAPGVDAADLAVILPAIKRHLAAARAVAESSTTFKKADLDALQKLVEGYAFGWTALSSGDALDEALQRARTTHGAFASRDLAKKQAAMRARFTKDSTIEIRGCAIGQTKSYMEAVQNYFGTSTGKPAVNAPDWYQFYGTIGLYVTPNSDAQIKGHWETWKDRADLQASLKLWAPVFAPTQKIPAKPTWADLATYLRAGHALPIKGGSRLFTLKPMSEDQVVDWLTRNEQRLSAAKDIKSQFAGSRLSEAVTKQFLIQWLQKDYGDPSTRLFSYDPAWATHFITLPGV